MRIKTEVDPGNYFRNEQSIPTLKLRFREPDGGRDRVDKFNGHVMLSDVWSHS